MSTKIYTGYVLPKLSLSQLQTFTMRVRQKMSAVHKQEYNALVARIALNVIDFRAMGKPLRDDKEDLSPLTHATTIIWKAEREIKRSGMRDPFFDFECETVFFPLSNKTLAILYAERKSFTKVWERQPEVKYYGYWNNTDWQDGVSEKEWNQRRKDWDKALPDLSFFAIPAMNGLVAQLTYRSNGFPEADKVLKLIAKISFEKRLQRIAEDTLLPEYDAQLKPGTGISGFDLWRKSAGQARWAETIASIEAQLPKAITKDILCHEKAAS